MLASRTRIVDSGCRKMAEFLFLCTHLDAMTTPRRWKIGAVSALLTLLVFQAGGWCLAWFALKYEARNTARHAMQCPDAPLRAVTLSVQYFRKVSVEEDEIRLENELYDIESQIFIGDSVKLQLYRDRQEESLLGILNRLFTPAGDGANSCPSLLQYWLAQCLCSAFLAPARTMVKVPREAAARPGFTFLMSAPQHVPCLHGPPPKGQS